LGVKKGEAHWIEEVLAKELSTWLQRGLGGSDQQKGMLIETVLESEGSAPRPVWKY